jgi:hypothetical protein
MKLAKLSLVAALAAGSFGVANATSLEDAIKNVDLSGKVFYRYQNDGTTEEAAGVTTRANGSTNMLKGVLNFKTAIDDNFFGVMSLRYQIRAISGNHDGGYSSQTVTTLTGRGLASNQGAGRPAGDGLGNAVQNNGFAVSQMFIGFTAGNTTVQVGKQALGAFWTDDMDGVGLKLLNQDIVGLTLVGVAFDNLQDDDGDFAIKDNASGRTGDITSRVVDENLYGLAALGSYDPVAFQLWFGALSNVAQVWAAEVSVAPADVVNVTAQVAGSMVSDRLNRANGNGLDDALFAGADVGFNFGDLNLDVGAVMFNTDKAKSSVVSIEDNGKFISAGEQTFGYNLFSGENLYGFVTAMYNIGAFGVGADFVMGKNTVAGVAGDVEADDMEVVGRVKYDISKKLGAAAWYSHFQEKVDDDKYTSNRFRLQAEYKF